VFDTLTADPAEAHCPTGSLASSTSTSSSAVLAGSCCCAVPATSTQADSSAFRRDTWSGARASARPPSARPSKKPASSLAPAALRHVLSIHQRNPGTTDTRIGFAFTPRAWDGEPVNAEPHKHSELIWADPAALPAETAEYTTAVITAAEHGLTFTLNGW